MGLVTSTTVCCYLDCFGAIFCRANFWAGRHTKVVIHFVSLSVPLSPLRQQPCLKAETMEQWPSHTLGGCIA
jgi:hypothetical protein